MWRALQSAKPRWLLLAAWAYLAWMVTLSVQDGRGAYQALVVGSAILAGAGVGVLAASLWQRRADLAAGGFVVLMVPVLLWGWDTVVVALGVGSTRLPVTVVVVDAATGRPVPDARVQLTDEVLSHRTSEGTTAPDGRVTLSHRFVFTDRTTAFRRSGWVRVADTSVLVDADGYEPASILLGEQLTDRVPLIDTPPLPPVIVVVKQRRAGGDVDHD